MRMNPFEQDLSARLAELSSAGLRRKLTPLEGGQGTHIQIEGRSYLNFSSNDYLGLAQHPALKAAAIRAIEQFGTGSGASRLICGSVSPHTTLEARLAQFKGTEASLSFTTGYAATLGTIGALLEKDDILIVDKLVHACVIDAARLCGARLRVFKHNDLEDLADILKWADAQAVGEKRPRVLVVSESVFSMDGDVAPLKELVELKDRHGAWLMVDEAHATGLFGIRRSGLAEATGVSGRIEIQMGTLGKALGSSGGYIAGSKSLIDLLVNKARSFIFSTAPVPAAAAAATAAIELVSGPEGEKLAGQLWSNLESLAGYLPQQAKPTSAIVPILIGAEQAALDCAQKLRDAGFFIPAIRYPTVARGKARLRVTVSAAHTEAELASLGQALLAGKVGA